ncbi:hypothetical protein BXZ70DRAFT_56869 [Cristinia sonorae]|uniref:DUF7587 domain-containing protein n=1 Tax=Cristinia sonorae TaxID=1940300 RepID=A0A8K0URB0_9AGAR|nr:hypothetical protein BXZ70DRAFT_56869 [Cristinia sonorae]
MSAGASLDSTPKSPSTVLPQYGFGPDLIFDNLLEGNPYLFRVHTPRSQSTPNYEGTEPYFVGGKYNDEFLAAAFKSPCPTSAAATNGANRTYADVTRHMDWTTRGESPYISTSFSFAWAIWEAIRRYHVNVKHNVEIAVIDARAVADRSVTAAELLTKATPKDRHKDHWKWYRFAVEAQDVLVWGHIPTEAVLSSIPLLQILSKLPTYFLYPEVPDAKDTPLSRISWDYTQKKPSFRQFCQSMSDRFLRMPVDKRLRDTTAGSVRLAMCLLRPYVHKHISDDFTNATTHVCELAYVIACWPSHWWAREHSEIRDLIRCVVHIVGEEMREARRVQALSDATRMQEIVGGLEQLAHAYETRARLQQKTLRMLPHDHEDRSEESDGSSTAEPHEDTWDSTSTSTLATMEVKGIQTDPIEEDEDEKSMVSSSSSTTTLNDIKPEVAELHSVPPIPSAYPDDIPELYIPTTLETVVRTASCFLTAFCIGSIITLCVLSPHRRELANHLT